MKIFFLGTNGWFDTNNGSTICTLIKTKACNLILDAGFGIAKADLYLDKKKPTAIFLSHLHLDHCVGLHALAKFRFLKKITIFYPQGVVKALNRFLAQPFTVPAEKLPFSLEMRTARPRFAYSGVNITCAELVHSSKCLGYRFKTEGKIIAYCTDTGVCDNAARLSQDADILITECALRRGQDDEGWPHLDPNDAARLAKASKVKQLILTHFDAHNYRKSGEREKAQIYARKIFPETTTAFDGMEIRI